MAKEYVRLCRYILDNILENLKHNNCEPDLFYNDLFRFYDDIMVAIIRLIELSHEIYLEAKQSLSSYFVYNIICTLNRLRDKYAHINILEEISISERRSVKYGRLDKVIKTHTNLNYPKHFIYKEDKSLSSGSESILKNISSYFIDDYKTNMGKIILMSMYTSVIARRAIKKNNNDITKVYLNHINNINKTIVRMMYDRLDNYNTLLDIVDSKIKEYDINYIIESFKRRFITVFSVHS